jgi:hypothetical protein
MFGSQTDAAWIPSISQQRQADLIADVRHDKRVKAALGYCADRTLRHTDLSRGHFGRIGTLVSATLRQSLRVAPFGPTPVHGG